MLPLSQLLRESSRPEHTAAESRPFITRLMGGELNVDAYVDYLTNLAPVYRALESKTHVGTPWPGTESLWDEGLDRLASIKHDLDALGSTRHSSITPEAREYAAHIDSLTGRHDLRLVAHHYTRYLGDLSGGQAIGALVSRHYGLTPEQLTFCDFPRIDNIVRFKDSYRAALDGIIVTESERKELVTEVRRAFAFNQAIFDSLGTQSS